MTASGARAAVPHRQVWDALLAYQARPGSFLVGSRQPTVLFDHTSAVLALAADRPVELPGNEPVPEAVRQAARVFVRLVMLRPGADHYAVLGADPTTDSAPLKEHYRLLMRMTHPDMQSSGEDWPADAASRVNLAYQVLSSAVERAAYDAQRATLKAPGGVESTTEVRRAAPLKKGFDSDRSRARASRWGIWAAGCVVFGALAVMGAWLSQTPLDDSLAVVRPAQTRASDSVAVTAGAAGEPVLPNPGALQNDAGDDPKLIAAGSKPAPILARVPAPDRVRPVAWVASQPEPEPAALPSPAQMPLRAAASGLTYSLSLPAARSDDAVAELALKPAPAAESQGQQVSLTLDRGGDQPKSRPVPAPAYDMRQMQPILTELLAVLGTGRPDQVQRWAQTRSLGDDEAARFSQAYERSMAGAALLGVGRTEFQLGSTEGSPVVEGAAQMRLLRPGQESLWIKTFRLRAQFRMQGDTAVLVGLEAL